MTVISALAMFVTLFALAAIPSSSVALVVTRSIAFGKTNGLATAAGVVAGDLIFVAMAIFGVQSIAQTASGLFVALRIAAGAYLIWIGINLLLHQKNTPDLDTLQSDDAMTGGYLVRSFGAGLLLTLGDVKAIFFYASLLPTFLDVSALSTNGIIAVSTVIIFSVGGAKVAYVLGAHTFANLSDGTPHTQKLKFGAGMLLMGFGIYLIFSS